MITGSRLGRGDLGCSFLKQVVCVAPMSPRAQIFVWGLRRRLDHKLAEAPSSPSDPAVLGLAAASWLYHYGVRSTHSISLVALTPKQFGNCQGSGKNAKVAWSLAYEVQ